MTSPSFELVIGEGCDKSVAANVRATLGASVPERSVGEAGQADIVVAVGGDGTIMRVARRVLDTGGVSRILGVSGGRLGFLAAFEVDELSTHLDAIRAGALNIESRHALRWRVLRGGQEAASGCAVNDLVLAAGQPFRAIELEGEVDGGGIPRFLGDGLIVATSAGSTAHAASAGGPIVAPGLEATILVPLAAHSLAWRPLVLPAEASVAFTVHHANEGSSLVEDGQLAGQLEAGDRVEVGPHFRTLRFLRHPERPFGATLAAKLGWAAPPSWRRPGADA
ncbi:MAG: hypothetical protein CMJ28_00405 [Phycisphaerae bacterium]|nr:hypothetical protein [Phycisphaerae bacterium]